MATPSTSALPPTLKPLEWFNSIGSPAYTVAPMVDQSELAWRILSRVHGATLAYTPMFHAAMCTSPNPSYFKSMFDTSPSSLEGIAPYDRPLIVQFCANDKDQWLAAAEKVVGRCDAVDLNLGCPQGIAKKGHYGAFLMEDWGLIASMISHLHQNLPIPVTAKLRIYPTLSQTLDYATHVLSAGAQLLTIHGRTRESKGHLAGLASWPFIRAVTESLGSKVPVLANGGIPSAEEVEPCLEETGAKSCMSAEGNLYNPMIFSPSNAAGGREYVKCLPPSMQEALKACEVELVGEWDKDKAAYAPATFIAAQYLAVVKTLPSTRTQTSAIKGHLFKLFRPIWATGRHVELRDMLGKSGNGGGAGDDESYIRHVDSIGEVVVEMRRLIAIDREQNHLPPNSQRPITHQEVIDNLSGIIPYSHAQPYLRIGTVATQNASDEPSTKRRLDQMSRTESVQVEGEMKKPRTEGDMTVTSQKFQVVPCPGSSPSSPCSLGNNAAGKCTHSVCGGCCTLLSVEGGSCEFHVEKMKKENEKAVARKVGRNMKREEKRDKLKVKVEKRKEEKREKEEKEKSG